MSTLSSSWIYPADGIVIIIRHYFIVVILLGVVVRVMLLNAIFNDISVISWRSVLLVEETGLPGENHRPVASH
jgi:hypothetical protein